MRWRRRVLAAAVAALLALSALLITARLLPLPARLSLKDSDVIEYADGTVAHVFLSPDGMWRVAIDESRTDAPMRVDQAYLTALLRLEDKRFYAHPGIDVVAIFRALIKNCLRGRVVSGASTLTMQLARLLEPRPRSLRAKLRQSFVALQLELRLSKRQILAAYLRFLPFGRNIEGIEAASLSYFGHSAGALSPEEIATLLAVPQDPGHRHPSVENAARLRAARNGIAARLLHQGALSQERPADETLTRVRAAPVPTTLQPFPRNAAHAAVYLQKQLIKNSRSRFTSTLSHGAQLLAERVLLSARAELARRNIHNAALVLVEQRTASIRALVGNFDFWDNEHGGQIAGFGTARSPGSALKPFIYALALDRGLVLPESMVADAPLQAGSYTPRNFDHTHSALVRIDDALSRSLNLPFIELLSRVGTEQLIATLQELGVHSLHSEPGFYGLSAAVGGIELTPLELAGLYTALAMEGQYRPLRLAKDGRVVPAGRSGFSAGAAYLTRLALSQRLRPDAPQPIGPRQAMQPIAWKTGTSFGHHDAWAAGIGEHYTAVVWVGNFDGRASKALVGADAAAPILFDLLTALQPTTPHLPSSPPRDVGPIEVCAYSGYPPGPACAERRSVLGLLHSVPTTTCPFHREIEVDAQSGLALSAQCRGRYTPMKKSLLVWPARLRRWLADEGQGPGAPPRYAPGCAPAGHPPIIISPPVGQGVLLIPGLSATAQRVPLAADSEQSSSISWFVDGEYLGTYPAQERAYYTPVEGSHRIVATDEAGVSAERTLNIRALR